MKSVLISIKPKWCKLILDGKKTVEVRKTRPKIDTPFKCYIYCTQGIGKNTLNIPIGKDRILEDYLQTGSMQSMTCPVGNGKVIGEFVCDKIASFAVFRDGAVQHWNYAELYKSCLTYEDVAEYIGKNKTGYAWHISNLVIYDEPIDLDMFEKPCSHECRECKYYNNISFEEPPTCEWDDFYITRPPQSWCYVEGMEA